MLRWITALLTATVGGCSGASTRHVAHGSRAHDHGHGARGEGSSEHAFVDADSWTGIFDDPARDSWQRPDDVLGALELEPGMTVADVGAGTGYFAVRLARALPRGEVIATDLEADMVRFVNGRARLEPLANLRAVQATATAPGLSPESVDRILIVHVWHHLAHRAEYARGLAAALRPAGRLLVVEFSPTARRGPPASPRVGPDAVVAELAAAGLSASVSPTAIPDQYIVDARRRP
jgi:arsenite methyltransferase